MLVGVRLARPRPIAGSAVGDARRPPPEELLDRLEDLHLADVPGDRHDQVVRGVPIPVVPVEVAQPDAPDRLGGAENRRPQRMAAPEGSDEHLVDEVVGVVVRFAELLQDDAALDLDVVGLERRREHDIAQQIHRFRETAVERVRVEAGVLLRREGVDVPAQAIDRPRDLDGRTAAGALEEDMLQEVGDPPLPGGLLARARPDEEAERERPHVLHLVDQDGHSVFEKVFPNHRDPR